VSTAHGPPAHSGVAVGDGGSGVADQLNHRDRFCAPYTVENDLRKYISCGTLFTIWDGEAVQWNEVDGWLRLESLPGQFAQSLIAAMLPCKRRERPRRLFAPQLDSQSKLVGHARVICGPTGRANGRPRTRSVGCAPKRKRMPEASIFLEPKLRSRPSSLRSARSVACASKDGRVAVVRDAALGAQLCA